MLDLRPFSQAIQSMIAELAAIDWTPLQAIVRDINLALARPRLRWALADLTMPEARVLGRSRLARYRFVEALWPGCWNEEVDRLLAIIARRRWARQRAARRTNFRQGRGPGARAVLYRRVGRHGCRGWTRAGR